MGVEKEAGNRVDFAHCVDTESDFPSCEFYEIPSLPTCGGGEIMHLSVYTFAPPAFLSVQVDFM